MTEELRWRVVNELEKIRGYVLYTSTCTEIEEGEMQSSAPALVDSKALVASNRLK
jgi:hypothetical protein